MPEETINNVSTEETSTIALLATKLLESRSKRETLEDMLKKSKRTEEGIVMLMATEMANLGLSSFKTDTGESFSRGTKLFASIRKELREEAQKKLKEWGTSLVSETVNAKTLSSFVKTGRVQFEEDPTRKPDWWDEFEKLITVFEKPAIRIGGRKGGEGTEDGEGTTTDLE